MTYSTINLMRGMLHYSWVLPEQKYNNRGFQHFWVAHMFHSVFPLLLSSISASCTTLDASPPLVLWPGSVCRRREHSLVWVAFTNPLKVRTAETRREAQLQPRTLNSSWGSRTDLATWEGISLVGSVGREPVWSAGDTGDMGSIPGSGRSPGGGHGTL